MIKLNLGCAKQVVEGWINVDYALGARLIKLPVFGFLVKKFKLFNIDWDDSIFVHDLNKPLPWHDNSVDVIYTSRTLEHLTKEFGKQLLEECHRVLKPNGLLRIVVPDFNSIVEDYNEGRIFAEDFCKRLVVEVSPTHGIKGVIKRCIEFPHQCMYTTDRLVNITKEIGFIAASKKPFDSSIYDIRSIETEDEDSAPVIVECSKRAE